MKTAALLVLLALVWPTKAASVCSVYQGHRLRRIGGSWREYINMDFPCKYNFIQQTCGKYAIKITTGNIYKYPNYFINTIRVSVSNGTNFWQGRTDNKITIKYINGNISEPFRQKGGNMSTTDLFKFYRFKYNLYGYANYTDYGYFRATSHDDDFQIFFRPYLADSLLDKGIYFSFYCRRPDDPPAFPQQMCGGRGECQVTIEAYKLGFTVNGNVYDDDRDKTVYYYVFTDNTTDQTPNPRCGDVVDTMLNVCQNQTQRVEAINLCYKLLRSKPHRKCVTKYSCSPIDVFYECVKYVCSDFTDGEACQTLGEYIDMCPMIPGLSEKVSTCYKSNLISFADLDGVQV